MSEIGGSEVLLLIIIGLIVLGPERLPRVANQLGSWFGQARRMTRMMKRQLEEEINLDLKKDLTLESIAAPKTASSVSSPTYVHDRTDDRNDGAAQSDSEGQPEEEDKPELPDDYSPAHAPDAAGTGVGDSEDAVDDGDVQPVAAAPADDAGPTAEPEPVEHKKETA